MRLLPAVFGRGILQVWVQRDIKWILRPAHNSTLLRSLMKTAHHPHDQDDAGM
jgi:hypothetical protein